MICSVCKKNRNQVTPRQSKLMPDVRLFLCSACFEGDFEPRYLIILSGRGGDMKSIRPYLEHHRYVGEEITAKQLLV